MTELFQRDWRIDIGQHRIAPRENSAVFSVTFEIAKSTQREPNTCSIKIANLKESTRRTIEQGDDLQVQVMAGYVDATDIIFSGDISEAWSQKDNAEIWLTIEARDGGTSYRTARINRGFEPGVSIATIIAACVDALSVGRGNSVNVANSATLDSGGSVFADGYTLDGIAWRELDKVCRSASLRWSVQNGALQLRQSGQPSETRAIKLTSSTGLIGTPTRGKKERGNKVLINARALLIPGLYPGRVVTIESATVEGAYLCKRVKYTGETTGQNWYADLELEAY